MQSRTKAMLGRAAVGLLTFSAIAFGALIKEEGYTNTAVIPVTGDNYTVGIGSTFDENGNPVKKGDTITPLQAYQRALKHIQQGEAGLKKCIKEPLTQIEYDTATDFIYNYGLGTFCRSSMARFINKREYANSCESYLLYRKVQGYDCSTKVNGKPNKRCWGVWLRAQKRYKQCITNEYQDDK